MQKREYLVQLEIKGAEAIVQERVVFIQNDAASGRLRLLITLNSEPYPLEGLSGEIAFLRPDGQVIIGGLTFDESGAYYDVQSSELYCAGTVNISVNLYDSTSRLTCARFPMYVEQELDTTDAVDASLAYPTILELLNSVDDLEERTDDLEDRTVVLEEQLTAGELTGDSAYEVAVKNGFEGTETQWLASLKGADGADGADGEDGTDGENGKSPYINDSGQWVIYNDDTGQYENTQVSAADSLTASDIPTQSGLNVQSELDILYSLLPGSDMEVDGYFKAENAAAALLPGNEETFITVYGQNLLYPEDSYVAGVPSLVSNIIDPSQAAQINSLTPILISFTPNVIGQGITFTFPGLPTGIYYVSFVSSTDISVSMYVKKTDGTLQLLSNNLGSPSQTVTINGTVDAATAAELYVAFAVGSNTSIGSPTNITMFQLSQSSASLPSPQRSILIDTRASSQNKTSLGLWPSWGVWGRATQQAQLRLISPIPSA